jgi:hypothetical protein
MLAPPALLAALAAALVFALGSIWFGRFELETPRWRRTLKLVLVVLLPAGLAARFGAPAGLAVVAGFLVVGTTVHFLWCRRHGIDPWTAEPWERYRALRGWPP